MLSMNRENVGAAIGRVPSGCAILSVTHQGRSTGVLVSWVQQAAFEPLMLSLALRRGRPAQDLVDAGGRFLLNVMGEDSAPLFRHFGRGFTLDEDAFTGLSTQETEFGPLILTCIAHIGCVVRSKVPAGDHDLYLVEAVAGRASQRAEPYVHTRNSGLTY